MIEQQIYVKIHVKYTPPTIIRSLFVSVGK